MVAVDSTGGIWDFDNWAYPVRLDAATSGAGSLHSDILQTQCTSGVRVALLRYNIVLAWWWNGATQPETSIYPIDLEPRFEPQRGVDGEEGEGATKAVKGVPCVSLRTKVDFFRLPFVPMDGLPPTDKDVRPSPAGRPRLVKIAVFGSPRRESLLGLTNQGHVVLFRDMASRRDAMDGRWQYVRFSSHTKMGRIFIRISWLLLATRKAFAEHLLSKVSRMTNETLE